MKTTANEITVKQIFNDVYGLTPKTTTISSMGSFVSSYDRQMAEAQYKEIIPFIPENTLAYKVITTSNGLSEKQLWVIAYELMKNEAYKKDLAERLNRVAESVASNRAKKNAKRETKKQAEQNAKAIKENNNNLQAGDKVSHARFGTGIVEEVSGKEIKVNFEEVGEKSLAKDFAKLNKIY